MNLKNIFLMLTAVACTVAATAKEYRLASPSGIISATVSAGEELTFSLYDGTECIMAPSTIGLEWMDGRSTLTVRSAKRGSADEVIPSPFFKKAEVRDRYNSLTLAMREGVSLELRVYDDGFAYRFVSTADGERLLKNEVAQYRFTADHGTWGSYVFNRNRTESAPREELFWTDMQNITTHMSIRERETAKLMFSPLLVELEGGRKLCLMEADVESYPGMYLATGADEPLMYGVFAPYPKRWEVGGKSNVEHLVREREEYIARIDGKRPLPWRAFQLTRNDGELTLSDMVYRLASPSRIGDTSWIKPGKVAWEWWNNWGLYDVDFVAGVNNRTYEYYIDFAAKYGIEYVILDEGWATKNKNDLFDVVPEIDIKHLVDYAAERGVGIILWAGYMQMNMQLEKIVPHYAALGVKGFKIDFLNRDDQIMNDFMYRVTKMCAEHRMVVNWHGCCKPTGLQRTYPNVINQEAVFGLEQLRKAPVDLDMVAYDVTLPFIRMVAGPMDYTQGSMRNSAKGGYYPDRTNPMSQGTRCHQLAEYVVFESPLNMLCDSPSNYMRERESIEFIAEIPTVWDETRVLEGRVGEYIVVARRNGRDWYIGAITDWTPRDLEITLPEECAGRTAVIFSDGLNAAKRAQDYRRTEQKLDGGKLTIRLAPGGGWAARIAE